MIPLVCVEARCGGLLVALWMSNMSLQLVMVNLCFHILLCFLSIVTDDESIQFQVNPVDTCFRVVGVFLSAPKGLSLGMHLYFLGLFYRELGFLIALVCYFGLVRTILY